MYVTDQKTNIDISEPVGDVIHEWPDWVTERVSKQDSQTSSKKPTNQLHLSVRHFSVAVVFQNVESLIGVVHMFDDNAGGGDLDSSPAANILGWRVTPVDLHKRQGSLVREPAPSLPPAALSE